MEEKKKEPSSETHSSKEPEAQLPVHKFCLNCGAVLTGKYCAECGQKDQEIHESFWHLIAHFAGDFFHFDSKFFRTLIPLVIRPGFLTNEYVNGKRANYMKPVQLYIFVSVIFFLFYFSFLNDKVIEAARVDENPAQHISDTTLRKDTVLLNKLKTMTPRAAEKVVDSLNVIYAKNVVGNALQKHNMDSIAGNSESDNDIQFGWTTDKNLPTTVEAYRDSINKLPKDQRPGWIKQAVEIKAIEINQRKNQEGISSIFEALTENFMHGVPKLMFLLLPFFALILKLLYVRRRVFLVDHAIFTLHFHSFIFLLLLVVLLINLMVSFTIGVGITFSLLTIYFVIALKKVYKQSWGKTIVKAFGTYFLYFLVMAFVVVIGVVISAASL